MLSARQGLVKGKRASKAWAPLASRPRMDDVHAPTHQHPLGCKAAKFQPKLKCSCPRQGLVKVEPASKAVTLLTSRVDDTNAPAHEHPSGCRMPDIWPRLRCPFLGRAW